MEKYIDKKLEKDLEEVYNKLCISIQQRTQTIAITPNTIQNIIVIVMEEVEKTSVKGSNQKILVLCVIKFLIDSIPDSNPDKKLLLAMYENDVMSNTIEIIISATKGEININQVMSCFAKCASFICK
jgi:hypothetical protein